MKTQRLGYFLAVMAMALTTASCGLFGGTVRSYGLRYDHVRSVSMPEFTNRYVAVADFDGDGKKDLLLGGDNQGTTTKTPVYLMLNKGNGVWEDATSTYISGSPAAANPYGVTADFNGDGVFDIAIFDRGNMELGQDPTDGGYYGEPPILLLSDGTRSWSTSSNLDDANYAAVTGGGMCAYDNHGLHAKTAAVGDFDGDGDPDIYVEPGGGYHQMWPHFTVNQGDGSFVSDNGHTILGLDIVRGDGGTGSWRYLSHLMKDFDGDGHIDIAMGQLRKEGNSQDALATKVVFNNGSGVFPIANAVDLPYPAFNDG